MSEIKLKPCPFCGGELRKNMSGSYEDCNKDCILYGLEIHEKFIPLWNTRKRMEKIVQKLEEGAKHYMNISEKAAELGEQYEKHMILNGARGMVLEEAIDIVKGGMK